MFFPNVIIFKLFFIIFISLIVTEREEGDRNSHTLSLTNKEKERESERVWSLWEIGKKTYVFIKPTILR